MFHGKAKSILDKANTVTGMYMLKSGQLVEKKAKECEEKLKGQEGFTTVEIAIVLVIICIIGVALFTVKDQILAILSKVGLHLKKVEEAIPAA